MKRIAYLAFLLLALAAPAAAQSAETAVAYDVGYFSAGIDPALGGNPVQAPNTYPVALATCNLPVVAPPSSTVTNPTFFRFTDPADKAKDCAIPLASTTLASVPVGTGYRAAGRSRGATTISAWGPLTINPFDVAKQPPPIPVNARVL